MDYYIADTHFGHEQILSECRSQFKDIDEMDKFIIDNINRKMTKKDKLYIIGDFSYRSKKSPTEYLEAIKPKKVLILGNHDEWVKKLTEEQKQKYFVDGVIYDSLMRKKNKIELHFCHYPMLDWNGSHYFGHSFSICGHIHQRKEGRLSAEVFPLIKNQFNAGVDINNFEPVTFEELIENNARFYQRTYTDEEIALLKDAVERLSK